MGRAEGRALSPAAQRSPSERSAGDSRLKHRIARGCLCTKAEKVFDTIVHKSFQRSHIYYISFTEAILIFSAWLTKELYNFDNIIFISGCCLI